MAEIMIVDDEPGMRFVIRRVLEKVGHEVLEASGGEECLRKLSKESVGLVFLDVMMPEMDGWEVLRRIKGNEELKEIPVVMLTLKPLDAETLEREEMGYLADYVTKPFSKEDLLEVVNQFNRETTYDGIKGRIQN